MAIPPGVSPGASARSATADALSGIEGSTGNLFGDIANYQKTGAYSPYEWALGGLAGMSPGNVRGHVLASEDLKQEGLPVYGEGGYHYEGGADVGRRSIWPTPIIGALGYGQQLTQEIGRGAHEAGRAIQQGEPISEALGMIGKGARTGLEDAYWNYRGLESEAPAWERKLQNLGGSIYNIFNRPKEEVDFPQVSVGLSPEIEARIQQDASRGLFDVNERSVAQLGPLTGQTRAPLTGSAKLIVDALNPPLQGDPADMARGREDLIRRRARLPSFRPFIGKGGLAGIAAALGLFSPRAEAPMLAPRRDYPDKTNPLQGQAIAFFDEDSPFRQQLPHNLFPPGYLRERAGRNAVEGVRQNLLGNLGFLPSTTSGALTPQELFKQRNDAEELRLREGSIPETSIWNPISAAGASMAPTSPDVIFNPPPVYERPFEDVDPAIGLEQEIENIMMRQREDQLRYLPGHPLYEAPFEEGTGPIEEFKPSDIRSIDKGGVYQPGDIRMVGDKVLLPGETVVDTGREAEKVRADNRRQADEAAARQKEVRADNRRRAEESREAQDRARENRERQEAQAERAKAIAKRSKAADDRKAAARQQRVADKAAQRERQATIQRQEDSRRRQASERAAKQAEKVRKAAIAAAKPTPVRRRKGGAPASRRVWKQPSRGRGR